jgi:phenylalanyl-tRNA synthetase beta chain
MFTWGEPLHAFDLDRLSPGEIIVRRAKKGEKILTIDGTARELDPGILIIADSSRPVAVAGVMGGKDTEVSTGTKNILLEAAVFDAALVRKGRQKLGLSTDSSYRFERGIDFETAQFSSWQAVGLIEEIASGECVLAKEEGAALPKTKSVIFDLGLTQKTLNVNIAAAKIKKILENLGFGIKSAGKNKFSVKIPSFREDVALPEDLVEEVTRVYGYEAIPETVPYVLPRISACQTRDLVSLTKNILVSLGLHEAITYSLVDKGLLKGFVEEGWNPVEIANPLSIEQEVLRTSLVPSLTRCVAFNLNQKQDYVNLFEVAGIFLPLDKEPKEELALGIALSGTRSYLLEQGLVKEEVTFLHLKGVIERLFERLGIKEHDFKVLNSHNIEIVVKDSPAGRMYQLEKNTLDRFDIKNKEVFVAQLSLAKLFAAADLKKKFLPPPKYPGITRDISFLIKEGLSVKEVLNSLYEKGRPLMRQAEIADYYKGKQVPQGFRSLTVSCLYRSDERTLTESEVTPVHNEVLRLLTEGFGAKIR